MRFWGSFGWHTVRFPAWLALLLTVLVVVAAVVTALWPARDQCWDTPARSGCSCSCRSLRPVRLRARPGLEPVLTTGKFPFIQGRYLFGGIVGIAILISLGVSRAAYRATGLTIAVVGGLVQAYALSLCLRTWWGGPGVGVTDRFRAIQAWSGWPGEAVAAIFVFGAAGPSVPRSSWCSTSAAPNDHLQRTQRDPRRAHRRPDR